MTKEELKQEAKEWIAKNSKEFITNPKYSPFDYAEAIYLAGAEPREKQIADLEDKLANADYQLEGRDNEIRELEAQIEKMKSPLNCKHSKENGFCMR